MSERPHTDGPPGLPEGDRLPLGRLVLALFVLIAGSIVLVVALARDPADGPSTSGGAATTPPLTPPAPAGSPAAQPKTIPEARPRPAPRERRARPQPAWNRPERHPVPQTKPPKQARAATESATPTAVDCEATVKSWGTAAHSPWAALADQPSPPALPAPIDGRYLALCLEVATADPGAATLRVADAPGARAAVRLSVDGRVVSPLGRLTDPPDHFEPFDVRPVRVGSRSSPITVVLVFLVPTGTATARLEMAGRTIEVLALPAEVIQRRHIEGVWRKVPRQRVGLRHSDPVADALCSSEHRVLAVRPAVAGGWTFEFPFTEVSAELGKAVPQSAVIELTLSRAGGERRARARLVAGGRTLILYLGEEPAERLVYKRDNRE